MCKGVRRKKGDTTEPARRVTTRRRVEKSVATAKTTADKKGVEEPSEPPRASVSLRPKPKKRQEKSDVSMSDRERCVARPDRVIAALSRVVRRIIEKKREEGAENSNKTGEKEKKRPRSCIRDFRRALGVCALAERH